MRNCMCGQPLKTNEQLRRGACSPECQRLHQPKFRPSGSRTPNTSFTVLSKPAVVRKPGTDNRKVSGE